MALTYGQNLILLVGEDNDLDTLALYVGIEQFRDYGV